jgi:hypothetical protein
MPMEACVHRTPYCSAVQLVWTSFASDFGLKAELGSTHGIGLAYSIRFRMERRITSASTRCLLLDCSRTPFQEPWNRFGQSFFHGGGWIYGGGWIWSRGIPVTKYLLTLDALFVCRSQVTGVVCRPCGWLLI